MTVNSAAAVRENFSLRGDGGGCSGVWGERRGGPVSEGEVGEEVETGGQGENSPPGWGSRVGEGEVSQKGKAIEGRKDGRGGRGERVPGVKNGGWGGNEVLPGGLLGEVVAEIFECNGIGNGTAQVKVRYSVTARSVRKLCFVKEEGLEKIDGSAGGAIGNNVTEESLLATDR